MNNIQAIHLTDEQVIDTLQTLASEHPDYVYESPNPGECYYFHRTEGGWEPGCIVGHVFARYGFDHMDGWMTDYGRANSEAVKELIENGLLVVSERAARILSIAQGNQDNGVSWGTAVKAALGEEP